MFYITGHKETAIKNNKVPLHTFLEKEMATDSSILAWKILWATVHGVVRVRCDLATKSPPPYTLYIG